LLVPVAVAFGADTAFVAADGATVAVSLLGATDGYADCVGNATPLNASTMNVTESFINDSVGRPYDKCGRKVVPFPQIFVQSAFRRMEAVRTHRIPIGAILPKPRLQLRPQRRRGEVEGRVAEEDYCQDAVLDGRADVGHGVVHDERTLRITNKSESLIGTCLRLQL
jgi:hypothetical protein